MTNKEFQEMLDTFRRLMRLIEKYAVHLEDLRLGKPLLVPPDVYDEICDILESESVSLFGIS